MTMGYDDGSLFFLFLARRGRAYAIGYMVAVQNA